MVPKQVFSARGRRERRERRLSAVHAASTLVEGGVSAYTPPPVVNVVNVVNRFPIGSIEESSNLLPPLEREM